LQPFVAQAGEECECPSLLNSTHPTWPTLPQ
jgi:hypothetical protein